MDRLRYIKSGMLMAQSGNPERDRLWTQGCREQDLCYNYALAAWNLLMLSSVHMCEGMFFLLYYGLLSEGVAS